MEQNSPSARETKARLTHTPKYPILEPSRSNLYKNNFNYRRYTERMLYYRRHTKVLKTKTVFK